MKFVPSSKKKVEFSDLEVGDVFTVSGVIFMRTTTSKLHSPYAEVNSVVLTGVNAGIFATTTAGTVEKLNVELHEVSE